MIIPSQTSCFTVIALSLASWLFMIFTILKRYLHLLQLDDYQSCRMIRASWKHWVRSIPGVDLAGLIIIAGVIGWYLHASTNDDNPTTAIIVIVTGSVIWIIGLLKRGNDTLRILASAKKALVMTSRARRIFLTALGLIIVVNIALLYFTYPLYAVDASFENLISDVNYDLLTVFLLSSMYITSRLAPIWLSIAITILQPVEKSIQRYYLNDARRILSEMKPLVIGITGSYGKTSTKEILAALLAEKYNVFKPPGSYNTLMGITRIIREQLRPFHEIFIAEMGAYKLGSIEKLCRLVQPKHGIITVIGVQHMERFKSRETIQRAKGELVRSLPGDGIAVLNGDDPLCVQIGRDFKGKVIHFSAENNVISEKTTDTPSVTARRIKIGLDGCDFTLAFPDGEELDMRLPLLGRSAVINATTAAAMADALGVPRRRIASVLKSIPQVRHRLELVKREDGVNIIDDAFNSNPVGAANALEALSKADTGRRILVTPGIIELGRLEEQSNFEFGIQAAKACDLAVLVGIDRIEPIKRGLLQNGFDERNVWIVPTFKEGMLKLNEYLHRGDTILLENDLPDQYEG